MDYPCAGRLLALDGRDGTKLWDIGIKEEVFAIQCGKLDINGDGHNDCIVAGRMSALYSIDLIKGKCKGFTLILVHKWDMHIAFHTNTSA